MFDTFICHQGFRDRLQQCALDMPNERKDQKALLSKAWNIRPMSYKQFSNLVSKKNSFYTDLVKINGEEDPLKRTLLIIDEAHKLYGGNDLNTNEKPDMDALHYALMRSYELSGVNSVRLLLMTATPITVDAMELIKLVNLCKPAKEQMPDHFYAFTDQYLEETTGSFTVKIVFPGSDSTEIVPLCLSIICLQMCRPNPEPSPDCLVVKNASKIWRRAFIRGEMKELSQSSKGEILTKLSDDGKTHFYYNGREMYFLIDSFHECYTENGKYN